MDDVINELYVYCTDLVINLANIFYLSYYEINTIIFCIIYPVFLIGLSSIYLNQKRRLKKLEK
jgi:hypothetical protein